jgi:GNAT superfamily N-acetyltransferase
MDLHQPISAHASTSNSRLTGPSSLTALRYRDDDRPGMHIDGYVVEPLTADRFDDFVAVVGRGGIGGCWCMYWARPTTAAWGEGCRGGSRAPNREAFHRLVETGPPPGLLVYDDGDPLGWCRVVPRSSLPGLAASRYFRTELDIGGVWSLPCFVVRKPFRRRGLTTVLTMAAIELARDLGGTTLEAYPWDTEEEKSPSTIYTGRASTFARLGFEVVQRRAPHKPMMRLRLVDDQAGEHHVGVGPGDLLGRLR